MLVSDWNHLEDAEFITTPQLLYFEERNAVFAMHYQLICKKDFDWRRKLLRKVANDNYVTFYNYFYIQLRYLASVNDCNINIYLMILDSEKRRAFLNSITVFEIWKCVFFLTPKLKDVFHFEMERKYSLELQIHISKNNFSMLLSMLKQTNDILLEKQFVCNYILNRVLLKRLDEQPSKHTALKIIQIVSYIKATSICAEWCSFINNTVFHSAFNNELVYALTEFCNSFWNYKNFYYEESYEKEVMSIIQQKLDHIFELFPVNYDKTFSKVKYQLRLLSSSLNFVAKYLTLLDNLLFKWILEKLKILQKILLNSIALSLEDNIWSFLDAIHYFVYFLVDNCLIESIHEEIVFRHIFNLLISYIEFYQCKFSDALTLKFITENATQKKICLNLQKTKDIKNEDLVS